MFVSFSNGLFAHSVYTTSAGVGLDSEVGAGSTEKREEEGQGPREAQISKSLLAL